jgi:hypothetical protein
MTDEIREEEIIWFPGIYGGRTTPEYLQKAGDISQDELIALVQRRAQEDGEWAIENGHVGQNEDIMRKMMEWVSRPKNILQCVEENMNETVDWICRDLANGSKWVSGDRG